MVTKLSNTLYDAIKGHEAEFESVVYDGIEKGLKDLGEAICDLEWASIAAKSPKVALAA